MSGGYFEYNQYHIQDIASEIERFIELARTNLDEDGPEANELSPETLERFHEAVLTLRRAFEMAERIDMLLSADLEEETFNERWVEQFGSRAQ